MRCPTRGLVAPGRLEQDTLDTLDRPWGAAQELVGFLSSETAAMMEEEGGGGSDDSYEADGLPVHEGDLDEHYTIVQAGP